MSALRIYPAADRNKKPIFDVLKEWITPPEIPNVKKKLLEISSGTGQHVAYIAPHFDFVDFQPTEFDTELLPVIESHCVSAGVKNVLPPLYLNVSENYTQWANKTIGRESLDYILNVNMIHVSPWICTESLFMGSAEALKMDGFLFTYGAYANNGIITPQSNINFDAGIRAQHPTWGLRDITKELIPLGQTVGIHLVKTYDLPANNKMLIWQKKEKNT